MAPAAFVKLEKILSHIKANDQVISGKISLADFTILQSYIMMCDAKMNSLDAFKTACPTAMKIVEKMLEDDKINALVKDAKNVPFMPW